MRFSINELQTMLGLSRSTILYYEERKILSPKRLKNGYREFSGKDMIRMKQIIVLRNAGLDVHEIERELMDENRDADAIFKSTEQNLRREIERKKRLLSRIEETTELHMGAPELVERKPYLITKSPCCDVEHRFFSKSRVSQSLIRSLGLSDIYFLIPLEGLQEEKLPLEKYMEANYRGIAVDCAAEMELDPEELRACSPGLCARVWAKSNELGAGIDMLRAYIKNEGLTFDGDAIIRTPGFSVLRTVQEDIWSEIFIPVKNK